MIDQLYSHDQIGLQAEWIMAFSDIINVGGCMQIII